LDMCANLPRRMPQIDTAASLDPAELARWLGETARAAFDADVVVVDVLDRAAGELWPLYVADRNGPIGRAPTPEGRGVARQAIAGPPPHPGPGYHSWAKGPGRAVRPRGPPALAAPPPGA